MTGRENDITGKKINIFYSGGFKTCSKTDIFVKVREMLPTCGSNSVRFHKNSLPKASKCVRKPIYSVRPHQNLFEKGGILPD